MPQPEVGGRDVLLTNEEKKKDDKQCTRMPQVTFSVPRGQQSRVSVLCNSVFVKNE
jgi:hypothetical protein